MSIGRTILAVLLSCSLSCSLSSFAAEVPERAEIATDPKWDLSDNFYVYPSGTSHAAATALAKQILDRFHEFSRLVDQVEDAIERAS